MIRLLARKWAAPAVMIMLAMLLLPTADAAVFDFSAVLTGSQEVPPTGSEATGTGTMTYDTVTNLFNLDSLVTGITRDELIASHIHVAPIGVNGPIIVPLGDGSFWFNTNGSIERVVLGGLFPEEHEAALLSGGTYINVHTPDFPGGEIRGQLLTVPEPGALVLAVGTLTGYLLRRKPRR